MTKEQDLAALKRYYIAEYFDGEEDEWPTHEEYEHGEFVMAEDADKILGGAVLQRWGGWGVEDQYGDLYLYEDVLAALTK